MIFFVGVAVLAFYFAVLYKSQTFTDSKYTWGKTPSILAILLKVLVRIILRRQGQIYTCIREDRQDSDAEGIVHLPPSPEEVVIINGYRLSDDLVVQYKAVCGDNTKEDRSSEQDSRSVPLCFPDCLFVYNLLLLVCKPSFKLSPLGLIHIGQTIRQHADLQQLLDGPCSLDARTIAYRLVPRGVEVDISVRVIAQSELCVWSGVATLLSRSRHVQSDGRVASPSGPQHTVDDGWETQDSASSQQIEAAGDTGVKYARVSGDWNPHHLYPWSASLLGYRAPIAHGLWTLAKAVALLSCSTGEPSCFREVECRFKRPFYLPGSAILQQCTDGSRVKFRVIDSKTRAPHLVGTLT